MLKIANMPGTTATPITKDATDGWAYGSVGGWEKPLPTHPLPRSPAPPLPLTLLLALLLLAAVPAAAQRDTTRVVLPDIAPREVEIRGTLEIQFPSLQRQPLVGFNPPPRVPSVPADRRPFAATYREAGLPLPESPLARPQPPAVLRTAPPAQGDLEVLGGRYYSRALRGYVTTPLGPRTALLTRLRYDGTDGFRAVETADGEPERRAAFDALDARTALVVTGDRWGGGVALDGFYHAHDLYGALPLDTLALAVPERDAGHLAGSAHLRTIAAMPVDARLEVRGSRTRIDTRLREDAAATALGEQRVGGTGSLAAPFGTAFVWAEADGSAGRLDDDLGWTATAEGAAGIGFRAGRTARLRVGARFVGAFSDTDLPRSAREPFETGYVAPDVQLDVWLAPGIALYGRQRPAAVPNTLAALFRENPYLLARPELRPTLRTVDAEGGLRLYAGPVQVTLRGGYQEMPQMLFFEAAPAGTQEAFAQGFTALRYAETEIRRAGGSVAVVLPAGLHAEAAATWRDGRFVDEAAQDLDIPYFAPVVGEATLTWAFPEQRGLLQLRGHVESSRFVDRANTLKVGTFVDVEAEAIYHVTSLIGLMLRIENVGDANNERWQGYPISPVVVGAGARIHW